MAITAWVVGVVTPGSRPPGTAARATGCTTSRSPATSGEGPSLEPSRWPAVGRGRPSRRPDRQERSSPDRARRSPHPDPRRVRAAVRRVRLRRHADGADRRILAEVPKGLVLRLLPAQDPAAEGAAQRAAPRATRSATPDEVAVPGNPVRSLLRLCQTARARGSTSPQVLRTIIFRESGTHPEVREHVRTLREGLHRRDRAGPRQRGRGGAPTPYVAGRPPTRSSRSCSTRPTPAGSTGRFPTSRAPPRSSRARCSPLAMRVSERRSCILPMRAAWPSAVRDRARTLRPLTRHSSEARPSAPTATGVRSRDTRTEMTAATAHIPAAPSHATVYVPVRSRTAPAATAATAAPTGARRTPSRRRRSRARRTPLGTGRRSAARSPPSRGRRPPRRPRCSGAPNRPAATAAGPDRRRGRRSRRRAGAAGPTGR